MDLESIVKALNLRIKSGEDKLKVEILGGYTGDLLSDVMGNSKEGDIWVTRQVHQNIVAVAGLKEHAGIILVQGCRPRRIPSIKHSPFFYSFHKKRSESSKRRRIGTYTHFKDAVHEDKLFRNSNADAAASHLAAEHGAFQ